MMIIRKFQEANTPFQQGWNDYLDVTHNQNHPRNKRSVTYKEFSSDSERESWAEGLSLCRILCLEKLSYVKERR